VGRGSSNEIVIAWHARMISVSELYARFEASLRNRQEITLVFKVKDTRGVNDVRVDSDTYIPIGVEVLSRNQFNKCLAKG
jgi:hypothetical protein